MEQLQQRNLNQQVPQPNGYYYQQPMMGQPQQAGPYVPPGYTMTPFGLVAGTPAPGCTEIDPEIIENYQREYKEYQEKCAMEAAAAQQNMAFRMGMMPQQQYWQRPMYPYPMQPQPMMNQPQPQQMQQQVYQQPQQQSIPIMHFDNLIKPDRSEAPLANRTEIPDLMGEDELKVPDDPNEAVKMIDDLIGSLQSYSKEADTPSTIEYGTARFGKESIGTMTSMQLVRKCIDEAMKYAPKGVNITYDLIESAYGHGMLDLVIYINGERRDKFEIDPYNFGGFGLPVLYGAVVKYDAAGRVVDSKKQLIPLGYTYALRQIIFRSVMGQPQGVTADIYMQYMHSLFDDPETYYLIDMANVEMSDDIKNYRDFGNKIKKISEVYPFKARYRLSEYTDNDDFVLISDNMVKPATPRIASNIPPANTKIEVIGNSLLITEHDNNEIKEIELSGD